MLQEGDIVNNNNTTTPSSAERRSDQRPSNGRTLKASMFVLNGHVPYIMAAGNHDFGITELPRTARRMINTISSRRTIRSTIRRKAAFSKARMNAGEIQNAYYAFTAPDGRKMLIFSLEWEPRPATVAWANQIAALAAVRRSHGRAAHARLFAGQQHALHHEQRARPTTPARSSGTNLVQQHENFEMMFNGHFGGDGAGYLASTGDCGQYRPPDVLQHAVRNARRRRLDSLLEFLEDGKTVRVRTYSPYLNQMRPHPELRIRVSAFAADRS